MALLEPVCEQANFVDRGVREHVHRAAGHVEDQVQDAVLRHLDPKLLQLRSDRHRSSFALVTVHWCTIVLAFGYPRVVYPTIILYTSKLNQTGRVLTMIERTIFREE